MNRAIACVVGTRPEVVKMAPVILRLRRDGSGFDCRVLATGQHRGLLDLALADFGLAADVDLDLMRPDQDLADLTARALTGLAGTFGRERPDLVLAQGDTTSVLCAALACYYQRIPFGHVEAGLRTGRPYFPFPEEKNRVLADHLADLLFAPTDEARRNLLREGVDPATIHVVGNTVIDALLMTARREPRLPIVPATERFLLVTAHRRESFGAPLDEICRALGDLVDRQDDLSVVFPVHPNRHVREAVAGRLVGRPRIQLIDPVGYSEFVALMRASWLILTDSGGVQEEAPSLGKTVLVLRDETERPEALAAGSSRLVGPHRAAIVAAVEEFRDRHEVQARPIGETVNPFGDGRAADRIADVLAAWFEAGGARR